MRLLRPFLPVLWLALGSTLAAQAPVTSQAIPAQALAVGDQPAAIDLRNHFSLPGVTGPVVQFDTVFGRFNVELRPDAAPQHVANFLNYVTAGRYAGSFIHRSASLDSSGSASIIQGGGYRIAGGTITDVAKFASVPLEYKLPNERGTLAAARTSDINSATSEWYFNVRDNTSILGAANGGGYTVFGRVMSSGMSVVDAIAGLPRFAFNSPFGELPLRNYASGDPQISSFILINAVSTATLLPSGTGPSVVNFSATAANPDLVDLAISASSLALTARASGSTTVTVRAYDTNANFVEATFPVTVRASVPAFVVLPLPATVATGSTAVLNASAPGAASYQWFRNGTAIPGATNALLVLANAQAPQSGTYTATATNAAGSVTTTPATLTVTAIPATRIARLINLSILTPVAAGSDLSVGAIVGPTEASGGLPLVVRAVGPTLGTAFGIPGVLADPQVTLVSAGTGTTLATNDNWGGSITLADAFSAVGAFALPAGSLDAAIVRPVPGLAPGLYSAVVSGKPATSGLVITEVYDASPASRAATAPRLLNVSVLKQLEAGSTLSAGFVLGGESARTVLIRAVGPTLKESFQIGNALADPKLVLFNGASVRIGENDNWGGDPQLNAAADGVGAFSLTGGSAGRDAALLLTLPPGNYSAQVTGQGGAGTVLVEVYEVP